MMSLPVILPAQKISANPGWNYPTIHISEASDVYKTTKVKPIGRDRWIWHHQSSPPPKQDSASPEAEPQFCPSLFERKGTRFD